MSVVVWWVKFAVAASAVWLVATWLYAQLKDRGWWG